MYGYFLIHQGQPREYTGKDYQGQIDHDSQFVLNHCLNIRPTISKQLKLCVSADKFIRIYFTKKKEKTLKICQNPKNVIADWVQ